LLRIGHRAFRLGALLLALQLTQLTGHGEIPPPVVEALNLRYAPYADWESLLDAAALSAGPVESYWQSAAGIRAERCATDLPLSGLHVALDPGHIGGVWAVAEGRDFQIDPHDFRVREGELVLEVAQRVRSRLIALGAEVSLLREGYNPVNSKAPFEYLEQAQRELPEPSELTFSAWLAYGRALQQRAVYIAVVREDLAARAARVNREIKPDLLLSLHINAAPWPKGGEGGETRTLVHSNHVHVLIPGCFSASELQSPGHQSAFALKLTNGSGAEERQIADALARALMHATQLPASSYDGKNAIQVDAGNPYIWARNLLLLRQVECPVVLLEPYVANSLQAYSRLQAALASRAAGAPPAEDDILLEYTDAVVAGVLARYGSAPNASE
jgi:N-acetylmuramoyl-L-alanine amidase